MIPWTEAHQASLSITDSWSLLKLMSIKLMMPYNHLNLCCPLLLLPSIFPSSRVFSNESVLHVRWPKYWSVSFSISPSSEYSGLTSFRMDWLDLLAVQGTLKREWTTSPISDTWLQLTKTYTTRTGQCEAVRVNIMTGGLDLSFGFPRNCKIPHPHQVTWRQPINMRPVINKGRAEKTVKVCTNKIALQTCNQSA